MVAPTTTTRGATMSRNEQSRTEIDIEIGPAHDGGPRRRSSRARIVAGAIVAIGIFGAGYATHAGAHHQRDAAAVATTLAPTSSTYAPIHLPPDGGADAAAVFFGAYPRRLEPPYCDTAGS
jgi:hypothetical protein